MLIYFQADDVVNVAIDKINALLESFMGINDTELGMLMDDLYLQIYVVWTGTGKWNWSAQSNSGT